MEPEECRITAVWLFWILAVRGRRFTGPRFSISWSIPVGIGAQETSFPRRIAPTVALTVGV